MLMGQLSRGWHSVKRHIDVFGSTQKGGGEIQGGREMLGRSVADRAAGEQGVPIERDIAADHPSSADRRRRNAVHRDLQTPGIAGAHRQSRPSRRSAALAGLQYARENHRLASVTDLYPAVGGSPDN